MIHIGLGPLVISKVISFEEKVEARKKFSCLLIKGRGTEGDSSIDGNLSSGAPSHKI